MPKIRKEKDSLGFKEVPANKYWGAQTQRALENFDIGEEKVPLSLVRAIALIKKSAALANVNTGKLSSSKARYIIKASDEVIEGKWDDHFCLSVWQTGSATQTHMNVNEVIANRASELAGAGKGLKRTIHPNDHVNHSQSTNDVLPTAMHIVTAEQLTRQLLPALKIVRAELYKKQKAFNQYIKIGRTHLQDAVPMTMGQEFSAYVSQLDANIARVKQTLPDLYQLPIGGTAVGTGLNADKQFAKQVVNEIRLQTGLPFKVAPNKFALMAAHDVLVATSGALKVLATSFMKLANDVRWLGSGPRCGLGELQLPENEPGSSIMPGKVNPTQCEAMMMVCIQVIANDTAITMANSRSELQLNVFKPIMIYHLLQSIGLLSNSTVCFTEHLLKDLKVNASRLHYYLHHSLMLVTCLTDTIGYDKSAEIALYAHHHHLTLKAACLKLGYLTEKQFDEIVKPELLV